MFKLRKNENTSVTIRAEDLQVNDRFVYDHATVVVRDIIPITKQVRVTLEPIHFKRFRHDWRSVCLYNEQFITVTR